MNFAWRAFYLTIAIAALTAVPAAYAAVSSDWSALKQMTPGERVKVSLTDGKSAQGDFQLADDNSIVIHLASGDQSFARERVRRVSVKRASRRGRHALIGAAIGAGAGLGLGAAIDSDCSPTDIICTGNMGKAIGTPLFALLGAGIGALLPAHAWHNLYRTD